jgi:predicted Zn-dependent protease
MIKGVRARMIFLLVLQRVFFVLPLVFVLPSCTANPATGQNSFTAFMSPQEEIQVGRKEHPKILKEFGGEYQGSQFNAYVCNVGLKLAKVSDMPNLNFTITVLNDSKVNAFALPGGFVYITRGLLALAENEAELAGVLAHEIGHVTARHTAKRYSQAMATNIGLTLLGVLTNGSGAGGSINQIAGLGAQLYLQGYSREQELESDLLAIKYMSRAGYDPKALQSFFQKMQTHTRLDAKMAGRSASEADQFSFFSTHPRTANRIAQATRLAKTATVRNPRIERVAFLTRLNGLTFGDDRTQGVRRGRTFSHPDLRFEFIVPPNFSMFNKPDKVVARGPQGSAIIFDMVPREQAKKIHNLQNFVVSQWGGNLDLRQAERLVINGLEAFTSASRVQSNSGVKDVWLVAIRGRDGVIFRFAFLSSPNMTASLATVYRHATYSFRRISAREAAAIRPIRIKVKAVKAGDTVQSLSSRQPLEKFKTEWFALINGLAPNQGLRTGQLVKVISE